MRSADIVRATAGHDGTLLKHTIRVVGKFQSAYLAFKPDSPSTDSQCEKWFLFVSRGHLPERQCNGRSYGVIRDARVDFHFHSVEISFSSSSIGNPPASYRWKVHTFPGDVRAAAYDQAARHFIEHSLG